MHCFKMKLNRVELVRLEILFLVELILLYGFCLKESEVYGIEEEIDIQKLMDCNELCQDIIDKMASSYQGI